MRRTSFLIAAFAALILALALARAGSSGWPPSPFRSGLMGAVLGGLLLLVLARFLFRRFAGNARPAFAGPNLFARGSAPPRPAAMRGRGGSARPSLALTTADFNAFEQSLRAVQAAWSRRDLSAMGSLATPEMVSYFSDQLAEQASRGVRNTVSEVRLEQGDLSEAWAERGREYATVAMRFSMVEVTRDLAGNIVDGHPAEHVQATEVWTFVRSPGGQWLLSAIQQTQ
jgi:predicted lipid-binding transport protein (Tim44 family)